VAAKGHSKLTCDIGSRPNAGCFGKLLYFHELRRRKLKENGKFKTLPGLIVTWWRTEARGISLFAVARSGRDTNTCTSIT